MSTTRELPFQAIVRAPDGDFEMGMMPSADDDEVSINEIEAAYLAALEAAEATEAALAEFAPDAVTPVADPLEIVAAPATPPLASAATNARVASQVAEPAERPLVSPRQVVEALLFVGGAGLTADRIANSLGGEFDAGQVHDLVDEIKTAYERERRPYQVVLEDEGYRLVLKSEFEKIRHRVYGIGPKEVKLAQDALEILALVAYKQPVTQEALDGTGRKNATVLVRQLLRRELVKIERDTADSKQISYRTTPRFLELFGITSLDDLPFPADFAFK